MKKRNKKAKRMAAELLNYWLSEAWHDMDNDYYCKMLTQADRELVKFYIHLYGRSIGLFLRCRYRPH